MNIHEFQAKEILAGYGVRVPAGITVDTPEEAVQAAKTIREETGSECFVVKAQIHAGGRGKGGGVKLARNLDEVRQHAGNILGMQLVTPQTGPEGKLVRKILITEDSFYPGAREPKELYVSILFDREKGTNMILASAEGGMDIEEVAEKTPEKIIKEWIDPATGLQAFQARKVAYALGLEGKANKEMTGFLTSLYRAYLGSDASQIEINPALHASDDRILALDAKINIDPNALYRRKEIAAMRDVHEEAPEEVEAGEHDLNYVKLDGNVGCMVNGAGLAMATMDIIKLSGGDPANFLDVGGTANAETVEAGFRIIMKDPNVKAILINIFGGIVRCDRVAQGVVEAYKNIRNINIPIIVRLQGTNAEEAAEIINASGLKVESAILLKDAAEKVKKAVSA